MSTRTRSQALLWGLVLLAFALRVGVRLAAGEAGFFEQSYSFYLHITGNFLDGNGLCLSSGDCARRMPIYPLLLAPFVRVGWAYPGIPILQAAAGAALVAIVWRIAHELFNRPVAVAAAAMTALHPYYVIHDTRLQETVWANVLMAIAVWLLLAARRTGSARTGLAAGFAAAAAVLTTARLAPSLPFFLLSVALVGVPSWRRRLRQAGLVALPIILLTGGWMIRNWHAVGAPVLTTESGMGLWAGNNPWTFAHFPVRSIDLSVREAYARLTASERETLLAFGDDVVGYDRRLGQWAAEYIREHPGAVLRGALRKVWVVVSAEYSPARGPFVQWGYFVVFAAVHVLAAVGLWQSRRRWREHSVVYAMFLSFVITTAVYWAHTSHKSYLDPFLFTYAAAGAAAYATPWILRTRRDRRQRLQVEP